MEYSVKCIKDMKEHFELDGWKCIYSNTDSLFLIPPKQYTCSSLRDVAVIPQKWVANKYKYLRVKVEDTYRIVAIKGGSYIYITESGKISSKSVKKLSELEAELIKNYLITPGQYNFVDIIDKWCSEKGLQKSKHQDIYTKSIDRVNQVLYGQGVDVDSGFQSSFSKSDNDSSHPYKLRIFGPKCDYIKGFDTIKELVQWTQKADNKSYSIHERYKDFNNVVRLVLDVDGIEDDVFYPAFQELCCLLKDMCSMNNGKLKYRIITKEIDI